MYYCEEIGTFYRTFYSDSAKGGAGQCKPSLTPGAYYTKAGDKDPDGKSDKVWSCWDADTAHHLRNDEEARKAGYEGACQFKDYSSTTKPADLKRCSQYLEHHPALCTPGPTQYWGACYSEHTDQWLCVETDSTNIDGYAKGDCKAQVPIKGHGSADPEPYFFDGACTFAADTVPLYKCDTVPGYDPELAGTCGQIQSTEYDKACFIVNPDDDQAWHCVDEGSDFQAPCDWQTYDDGNKFYKAGCVFKQNDLYSTAKDASNLTLKVKQPAVVI